MPGFRWRKEGPLPQVLAPVRRLQQPLGRVGGHLPGRRHTMGCLKGVQGLGPIALAAKIDSALGRAHATLPGFRWTRGTHPATCPSKTFTDPSDWLVVSTWRVPAPKDSLHRSSLANGLVPRAGRETTGSVRSFIGGHGTTGPPSRSRPYGDLHPDRVQAQLTLPPYIYISWCMTVF